MDWRPDCIPCVLRMAMSVARQALDDDDQVMAVLHEVIRSPDFAGSAERGAAGRAPRAPEVVRDVWMRLVEITGESDMLREEKARQNNAILAVYPGLREHVRRHADPFAAAMRLAIMGNALDMMVSTGSTRAAGPESLAAVVRAAESAGISAAAVDVARERLARAGSIVYFGDNCGEVVMDRLFIETLRRLRGGMAASEPSGDDAMGVDGQKAAASAGLSAATQDGLDVVFVTRTLPSGNDVTPLEAEAVGMGEVARILPNGIPVPLPGTDLRLCSEEVLQLVDRADLVISKGGANFELLDEEEALAGKVTFLLHGKCRPLCGATGVGPGDLVVANR